MMRLARALLAAVAVAAMIPAGSPATDRPGHSAEHQAVAGEKYLPLLKPGRKIPLEDGYSFVYGFDRTPKIGTSILKVQVFDPAGKQDTSFEIRGEADMPSMRGAHSSGSQPFRLSKKGDYLLPVNVVMPGEWEVRITILRNGKPLFRGFHLFDV